MTNNIILAGVPRSGSTLTCLLLNQLPDTVALHEPIQPYKLASFHPKEKAAYILQFFRDERERILLTGEATSISKNGKLLDNSPSVAQNGKRKVDWDGFSLIIEKTLPADFILVIKQPGLFTGMLGLLSEALPCFATVRNPLSVLLSWQTVDMPIRQGRAPAAEACDNTLTQRLDDEPDVLQRQLILLSWYYEQIHQFIPNERLIRYEDTIISGGTSLIRFSPSAKQLSVPLASRNASPVYAHLDKTLLAKHLLDFDGGYWHFYRPSEVTDVLSSFD